MDISISGHPAHGDFMTKNLLSENNFIVQLRHICEAQSADGLSLDIDTSKTWPHFRITCSKQHTTRIEGFYVENGDSFWRVSESGREQFTGNASSARRFLDDIASVIHVIVENGCSETQWKNQTGNLARSEIIIRANGRRLIFGKSPAFWQRGLVKEQIAYVPCR
jgi:hypothetical protein